MIELLKIEYLKVKNYPVFWAFTLIYAVFLPLTYLALSQIEIPFFPSSKEIFGFPTVWRYVTYFASWWNFLPGLLIIILICNEISFRTQKQNVIDGMSRKEVLFSKFYIVTIVSLISTIYVFLLGFILGLIFSNVNNMFSGIDILGIYLLQTFGYLSLAMLLGILLRKTSLAVLAFLIIFFILPAMLSGMIGDDIAQFLPVNVLTDLTPFPFFRELLDMQGSFVETGFELSQILRIILGIIYSFLFTVLGYVVFKKRDL